MQQTIELSQTPFVDEMLSYIGGCGQAMRAIEERDAVGLLCSMENTQCLAFVFDNCRGLKMLGMYEDALLHAFTGTRTNHAGWSIGALEFLFQFADRDRLAAAGDPLPEGDRFELFRGVAGRKSERRVRSFSWTDDRDRAEWFANWLELEDPAVYRAVVQRDEVLAYVNDRGESEFIVRPQSCRRVGR